MLYDFNTGPPLPDEYHSTHWNDLFHRCRRTEPTLFHSMHNMIGRAIRSGRYAYRPPVPPLEIPNSTWLGDRLFSVFPLTNQWNAFCRLYRPASNSLFGQIMWNVMALDHRDWFTIVTPNANPERTTAERVYWLRSAPRASRT